MAYPAAVLPRFQNGPGVSCYATLSSCAIFPVSVSWLKNRTHKPPQFWSCFQTINFGCPIILSHSHRGPLLFPSGSFHCFPQFPRDRAAAALGHGWPLWPAYESWESLPGKIRSRSPCFWGQLQGNWLSTGTVSCQICNDNLEGSRTFRWCTISQFAYRTCSPKKYCVLSHPRKYQLAASTKLASVQKHRKATNIFISFT